MPSWPARWAISARAAKPVAMTAASVSTGVIAETAVIVVVGTAARAVIADRSLARRPAGT